MDVDQMPAGREMDALVQEWVLGQCAHRSGYEEREVDGALNLYCVDCGKWPGLYQYSTALGTIGPVLDKMAERYHWRITSPFDGKYGATRWFAGLTPHSCTGWNGRPDIESPGETLMLAVCRAALKAMDDKPAP